MTDVDRLFSVPLEDFVAERKRVAKELRDAGDRSAATEVAKLPKPTPPAWALNRLAHDDPDAVAEWLAAAEHLRDASASPGAGLREAMASHREATRRLVATVRDNARPGGRKLSEPMLERVRALLQAATIDEEQAEALRAGRMVEGDELPLLPGSGDGRAPDPAPSQKPAKTPAKKRGEDAAAEKERAAKAREAERERKERERAERVAQLEAHVAAAEEELARRRDETAEREAAAAEADERLEEAQRTLHRSESEAGAAHAAADEARTAMAAAERELRQLARQLRSASS